MSRLTAASDGDKAGWQGSMASTGSSSMTSSPFRKTRPADRHPHSHDMPEWPLDFRSAARPTPHTRGSLNDWTIDFGKIPMRTLPAQMTAVGMSAPGGAEVLMLEQRAVPTPNQNELLIKVATAGINRGDVVQRRGSYAPPPGASDILGLEVAGEVVA